MQERCVSYGGESYALPQPFFVLATQNPVEQAGTYSLPEAQLDRFLMFIRVGYPTAADEIEILKRTTGTESVKLERVLTGDDLIALQKLVRSVDIADALLDYVSRLVRTTRPDDESKNQNQTIKDYVRWGAGPRAGQALVLCAKAKALLSNRYAVSLDDIKFVAPAVLRHRILLNFQAEAENINTDQVVSTLLASINEPSSPLV